MMKICMGLILLPNQLPIASFFVFINQLIAPTKTTVVYRTEKVVHTPRVWSRDIRSHYEHDTDWSASAYA